jgi:hypothetical protein
MSTSKRPQIFSVQYPRIPNRILEGVSCEEVVDDVVAEVVTSEAVADETMKSVDLESMECRDTQISCIAARVWQSHSRHAYLKKVSNQKRPSTQRYLAGPIGAHPTGRSTFLT